MASAKKKTKAFGSFLLESKRKGSVLGSSFGHMHFTNQMKKVWELGWAFKVFSIFLNRLTS